jgi:hypothetical protein
MGLKDNSGDSLRKILMEPSKEATWKKIALHLDLGDY